LLAVVAALWCIPALWSGLAMDDYILRGKVMGYFPARPDSPLLLELFRFMSGDPEEGRMSIASGLAPWYTDPLIQAAFFRPLSAATHLLDFSIWPENTIPHHAHSILWYALGVLVVALLFRRMLPPAAAGLAGLMFALEDAHYMPVSWLSNRNALLALAFGAVALLLHRNWREQGGLHRLALALTALAAGLFSGEVALGAVAYIAAYQLTLDRDPLVRRLARLAPYLGLVLVWGIIYRSLGFGSHGSGMYVDPLGEPLLFLQVMAERLPALVLAQWLPLTSDVLMYLPRIVTLVMAGLGVVTILWLWRLFAPLLRESNQARFWALGTLLSIVPVCGVIPMDRLLLFPGIGAFGLLALQVERLGWFGGASSSSDPTLLPLPAGRRWAFKGLLVLHVVCVLPFLPLRIGIFQSLSGVIDKGAMRKSDDPALKSQTSVCVNAFDIAYVYTPLIRQANHAVMPVGFGMLTSVKTAFEISRPDARSLVIRPHGGFLAAQGDRLFRGIQRPFAQGQRIHTKAFDVVVLKVTADGRPAEVRFLFKVPLEHKSLEWVYLNQGEVLSWTPPKVGETRSMKAGMPSISTMIKGT